MEAPQGECYLLEKHYCAKSKEQKHIIILFPFWNLEKAEKILNEQERNGYRFVRLRLGCFFTFQKSTPREVHYVFTYSFPKEYWPVLEWESALKSDEFRANVMHQGQSYGIFRIAKDNVDLQDFYVDRLWYAKHVLIQKTIIAIALMLPSAFAALASDYTIVVRLFFAFIFVGSLLELIFYIVGFCITAQKKKKLGPLRGRFTGNTGDGSLC